MNKSWVVLGVASLLALAPWQAAQAAPAQIEQAMTLIRATCSLPGSALEIKPTPEGRLELRISLPNGQRRSMTLVSSDIEAFSSAAADAMARSSLDMGSCMDPYLNDVISSLPSLPERPTGPAASIPLAAPARPFVPPVYSPPPAAAPAPALSRYPATGDLPVGAINNPGVTVAVAVTPAAAPGASGELLMRVSGCRAAGNHVVCDVKVNNETGKDVRLVVQGGFSKLYGDDGTQIQATWVTLGNQQGDLRHGNHQAQVNLIAGTAPVVKFTFYDVPTLLTTIKRLEVSMGPQTSSGVELQKITLADVPIQGR